MYLIWMLKGRQNRSTFALTRSAFLTVVLFSQLSSSFYVKGTPSDLAVPIGTLIKELNNVPLCILPTTVLPSMWNSKNKCWILKNGQIIVVTLLNGIAEHCIVYTWFSQTLVMNKTTLKVYEGTTEGLGFD